MIPILSEGGRMSNQMQRFPMCPDCKGLTRHTRSCARNSITWGATEPGQQMVGKADMPSLNGASTYLSTDGSTVFIRLPRELWRSAGPCGCPHCKGKEGFWDTLAVSTKPTRWNDTAWTVHFPVFGK